MCRTGYILLDEIKQHSRGIYFDSIAEYTEYLRSLSGETRRTQ